MHAKKVKQLNGTPGVGRPKDTPSEDSLPTRLTQLAVGQSESRSTRLLVIVTDANTVSEAGRKLANTARSATTRASRRTNGEHAYTIDTGHFLTHDHRYYVVSAVVTRIK